MFADKAQIFVQVLGGQKALGRNVVELAVRVSPEDRVHDGEFACYHGQALSGVGRVEEEGAVRPIQCGYIVADAMQVLHLDLVLEYVQRIDKDDRAPA